MALLYDAELVPSKLELIEAWAPTQPWFEGAAGLENIASYRFDDPQGQVGIEIILVRSANGPVLQVSLTYRDTPLLGGEAWFIQTMEHSVLGRRWVYDAPGDPVYIAALATTILAGGRQADMVVETGGTLVPRASTALVVGSGTDTEALVSPPAIGTITTRHENSATLVETGGLRISIPRMLISSALQSIGTESPCLEFGATLTGTWTGQTEPLVLARLSRS